MRPVGELWGAVPAIARSARSVSFSQYGEDVMLSVTLLPAATGFYVDAGAYHPWRGSNTYKLYLRGWAGLTIEPNPMSAAEFRKLRPRDVHLVAGIADQVSLLSYYQFADAKLNTFSVEQAADNARHGSASTGAVTVPCGPLQAALDSLVPGRQIDLLSVDCEGFDLIVLQTLDFARNRPTVVLIEDFDRFQKLRRGGEPSPIETHLRDLHFEPLGQAMFTTLYVDSLALRERTSSAFDLRSVQF